MSRKKLYINYELLMAKIADLEKATAFLNTIARKTEEEFLSDQIFISSAKYELIVAIEAAQSICNHLAARVAKEAPDSYADCFRILGKDKVISQELAKKLVSMAKFRNLLVHQYGKVDDTIVYGILKNDTADLITYIEQIKSFLKAVQKEEQREEAQNNEKSKALPDGCRKKEN
ncbi:MAG: DUF86 domain-containing protein [Bacillota bacterium]